MRSIEGHGGANFGSLREIWCQIRRASSRGAFCFTLPTPDVCARRSTSFLEGYGAAVWLRVTSRGISPTLRVLQASHQTFESVESKFVSQVRKLRTSLKVLRHGETGHQPSCHGCSCRRKQWTFLQNLLLDLANTLNRYVPSSGVFLSKYVSQPGQLLVPALFFVRARPYQATELQHPRQAITQAQPNLASFESRTAKSSTQFLVRIHLSF